MQPAGPIIDPIEVRRYGTSGPYVVLLHGGPGAPGEMAPVARRLESRYRVLEPLQRAGGEVPLSVARHVADLREALEEPVKEGPVRLVGYSWGGMLALTYAARHPADVERVIVIGCGTFDRRARKAYQACLAQRMDETIRRQLEEIKARLAGEGDRGRRNELLARMGALYESLQSVDPLPAEAEGALPCDEKGFEETWKDALALQARGVQPAEFAHVRAPVTMIHGDSDPHPGRLIHRSLSAFIPEIQYRELPRCGHKLWVEREAKEEFYKILDESLA